MSALLPYAETISLHVGVRCVPEMEVWKRPHQFIFAAIRDINSGSSKVSAVAIAPASIKAVWLRLVLIPTVAIPAENADLTPERESSKAMDKLGAAFAARNPSTYGIG